MYTKSIYATAVALAASSLVSAQTSTKCNPLQVSCPNDPAFSTEKVSCDWSSGACSAFDVAAGTTLSYGSNGALFSIKESTNAPTINTEKYIFFGRVDIEVQAAAGQGIVTSAVLQSDDLDEIDIEWVGSDNSHFQSNYFSQGRAGNYDRGAFHPVSNPFGQTHTYSILWTPTSLQWMLDGNVVRTLNAADCSGVNSYPQTPMQIKLGTWVAGLPDAPKGTIQWAGGLANFANAPFNAYYKSISIVDFAGGSGPSDQSVAYYMYGNHDGTWESIKVVDGNGSSSSSNSTSSSAAVSSSTMASTMTSASASTMTSSMMQSATNSVTTMMTTTGSGSSGSGSGSGSATGSMTMPTTTSTTHSGASQNIAAFSSLALAGALILAQLL